MKINNELTVSAPVEQAWETMLNLFRSAPCLPGAAIQEEKGDGEYDGTMKVKIGPITANYKGTVKFEETDEANHRAVLQATGRDARGQGTAPATITSTLQEEGDKTRVSVETDMKLTGRAAQFGRGIAQDVATKMLTRFAECLEAEIAGGPGDGADAAPQQTPAAQTGAREGGGSGRAAAGRGPTPLQRRPQRNRTVRATARSRRRRALPSAAPRAGASAARQRGPGGGGGGS